MMEMDTDSLYLVLSTPSLEDAVRPELRQEFFKRYHHWFPSQACDNHMQDFVNARVQNKNWVPTDPCCRKRHAFDKRGPVQRSARFLSPPFSVSNLALRYLFKTIPADTYFSMNTTLLKSVSVSNTPRVFSVVCLYTTGARMANSKSLLFKIFLNSSSRVTASSLYVLKRRAPKLS